jgi:hypothetical protein
MAGMFGSCRKLKYKPAVRVTGTVLLVNAQFGAAKVGPPDGTFFRVSWGIPVQA